MPSIISNIAAQLTQPELELTLREAGSVLRGQAMQGGGTLKVRTRREPTDVMVEIRDNDSGIPDSVKSHIFEPFFTTKPVGEATGLGLDAIERIVRRHGGNIHFESKPGDTCFQVRLPFEIPT